MNVDRADVDSLHLVAVGELAGTKTAAVDGTSALASELVHENVLGVRRYGEFLLDSEPSEPFASPVAAHVRASSVDDILVVIGSRAGERDGDDANTKV